MRTIRDPPDFIRCQRQLPVPALQFRLTGRSRLRSTRGLSAGPAGQCRRDRPSATVLADRSPSTQCPRASFRDRVAAWSECQTSPQHPASGGKMVGPSARQRLYGAGLTGRQCVSVRLVCPGQTHVCTPVSSYIPGPAVPTGPLRLRRCLRMPFAADAEQPGMCRASGLRRTCAIGHDSVR